MGHALVCACARMGAYSCLKNVSFCPFRKESWSKGGVIGLQKRKRYRTKIISTFRNEINAARFNDRGENRIK